VTSASPSLIEPSVPTGSDALGSRSVEFLLVGGATLLLFPIVWLLRAVLGLDDAELAVGFLTFHGAHLINDPHFSVTYFLFYRNARARAFGRTFSPAQRVRYWVAGFVVPAVLAAWAVAGIAAGSAKSLGWLIQAMFFLVGWHYVKQGFGVLSVLSARRGVRFDRLERWVFLAHCFAGWAYAWASPADVGKEVEEKGVVYTTIAHGPWLEQATLAVFALSGVALLGALVRHVRRHRRLPPLAPLTGFLVTVWLWTIWSSVDPLMVYLIPALHSVQYLYFVWLIRRNEARSQEGPPAFGRPARVQLGILFASALALGWLLFHGAPDFLDGVVFVRPTGVASDLGATPFFAALFAFVNIHHYFMDHVIWRRENPDTRFLRG